MTPIALVVSARVSYTQFWKESGNFEKYCKERMKNARKLARSRRHKDYFNECWDYVEFCGERMNLSVSYEKQKDYIKNLYKNEDYMTLERVFRPYFKMMQKSLQKNELFAEDEEIFDIYVDVLEKTGKTVQRSKNRHADLTGGNMKLSDYIVTFLQKKRNPPFLRLSGNHDRTSGRLH